MYLQIKVICLNKRKEASVPRDHEAGFAEVSHEEIHKALETKPQLFFLLIYFNWKPQLLKRMLCRDRAVVLVTRSLGDFLCLRVPLKPRTQGLSSLSQ